MLKSRINFAIILSCFLIGVYSCKSDKSKPNHSQKLPKVTATSAMKNVMWKGELFGKIQLDTLTKKGLYGLGPQVYLQGEIVINNGDIFVSKATSDTTMIVVKTDKVLAPFFVHTNVTEWKTITLPSAVKSISDLEQFIKTTTETIEVPFAFKLEGQVNSAKIHIQNLPEGTKVSTPKEAHQGQVNYNLTHEDVTIIGFYSENDQGVFTHHDSFLHMHLITKDKTKMGHLDAVEFNKMELSLPK